MARYKFAVLFFVVAGLLSAQTYPDRVVDSLLQHGIELYLQQDYEKAISLSAELNNYAPKTPWAELNEAGAYIMQSFDFGIDTERDKIDSLLDVAEEKSVELLDEDPGNPWNLFFMGSTKGFESYFFVSRQDYLSAITEAFFAVQYYNHCLKIDSTFYQAYMPIGNYLFWRSVKTEFLHWLPFVEDETDRGLMMLERAYNSKVYNNYLAANSLCWAYIYQKNYNRAAEIALEMLKIYPTNRIFKLALARVYQETDPLKAVEIFNEVRNDLKNLGRLSETKSTELIYRSGVVLYKNGFHADAGKYFRMLVENYHADVISDVSESRIEKAKEYLKLIETASE